jgi:hypothetical protein
VREAIAKGVVRLRTGSGGGRACWEWGGKEQYKAALQLQRQSNPRAVHMYVRAKGITEERTYARAPAQDPILRKCVYFFSSSVRPAVVWEA